MQSPSPIPHFRLMQPEPADVSWSYLFFVVCIGLICVGMGQLRRMGASFHANYDNIHGSGYASSFYGNVSRLVVE